MEPVELEVAVLALNRAPVLYTKVPLPLSYSNIIAKVSAPRVSKCVLKHTRILSRRKTSDGTWRLAELQQRDGEFTRLVAQVEERQHSYAENVHRLDVVNGLVTKQRLQKQEIGGEQEDYDSMRASRTSTVGGL